MFCPECRTEYREGFYRCADCDVALVSTLPPEEPQETHIPPDLVMVFESSNQIEVSAITGILEDSGLPYWTQSIAVVPGAYHAFPLGRFWVTRGHEAEARALLAPITMDEAGTAEEAINIEQE